MADPRPSSLAALAIANRRRTRAAAQRDQAIAGELATRPDLPALWVPVVTARAQNPSASWAQIGVRTGLTRNQAVSRFRRAAISYGYRERGPSDRRGFRSIKNRGAS